jgi:hypothetical protein
MVTGKEPWEDQKSLVEIAIGVSSRGWRLPIPDNCPPQLAGTTHRTHRTQRSVVLMLASPCAQI